MKYCKYLCLALSLVAVSVQAETLDIHGGLGGIVVPTNAATKLCVKLTVIKRNSGTLITGLTTAKIKPVRLTELSISLTTGQQTSKNFNVSYSLAASTVPAQAGVYDLCMTPIGVGNVWKKAPLPASSYSYYLDAVVLGTVAADNGVFSLFLN